MKMQTNKVKLKVLLNVECLPVRRLISMLDLLRFVKSDVERDEIAGGELFDNVFRLIVVVLEAMHRRQHHRGRDQDARALRIGQHNMHVPRPEFVRFATFVNFWRGLSFANNNKKIEKFTREIILKAIVL